MDTYIIVIEIAILNRPALIPCSWIRLLIVFAYALLVGACGKSERAAETKLVDQATQTYGFGMIPNPAVTYQPDVIVVGGGPKAIRSASADGLMWIIDGRAQNARELRRQ